MNANVSLLCVGGVLVAGYAALFLGVNEPQGAHELARPAEQVRAAGPARLAAPRAAAARDERDEVVHEVATARIAQLLQAEEVALEASAAAAEAPTLEPVVRIARGGRHAQIARSFGWPTEGWQAQALEGWLGERSAALAAWTATRDDDAFNQASDALATQLVTTFGRPAAEDLAPRVGLRRIDPATGELRAVDLDGQPLPVRAEAD